MTEAVGGYLGSADVHKGALVCSGVHVTARFNLPNQISIINGVIRFKSTQIRRGGCLTRRREPSSVWARSPSPSQLQNGSENHCDKLMGKEDNHMERANPVFKYPGLQSSNV